MIKHHKTKAYALFLSPNNSQKSTRTGIGGKIVRYQVIRAASYHFNTPWFMLLDSSGNVLKEVVYADTFVGGGRVFPDKNGGYFHWGGKDSLPTPYPKSPDYIGNYPYYLSHLDTDFKMEWRISFPAKIADKNVEGGYGSIFQVIQTKDNGYLVIGDHDGISIKGWLAKIDKWGHLKWEHTYYQDSVSQAYLSDVEEREHGGFIVTGWTHSCKTCSQDVWLLSVDSNGCELAGCSYTTAIHNLPIPKSDFIFYPNPTTGAFTVSSSLSGTLIITNIQGIQVAKYDVTAGTKKLSLPVTLAPGIYIGQYRSMDGKQSQTVRISYQP